MPSAQARYVIPLERLTPDAFAAFGTVVTLPTTARRHFLTATGAQRSDDLRDIWISASAPTIASPIVLRTMEKHPFSPQTFIPLARLRFLVAVCRSDINDLPDPTTMRAFGADESMILTYARGVWHHPMRILEGSNVFAVALRLTGRGDDDVFVDLDEPVDVVDPGATPP